MRRARPSVRACRSRTAGSATTSARRSRRSTRRSGRCRTRRSTSRCSAPSIVPADRSPTRSRGSALLRPIVQDALLPPAAYVAGPGEASYFAQVAAIAPHFDLPPPLVVPRARLRIVDEPARALLDKLGLQPADAERPRDEILRLL